VLYGCASSHVKHICSKPSNLWRLPTIPGQTQLALDERVLICRILAVHHPTTSVGVSEATVRWVETTCFSVGSFHLANGKKAVSAGLVTAVVKVMDDAVRRVWHRQHLALLLQCQIIEQSTRTNHLRYLHCWSQRHDFKLFLGGLAPA